MTTTLALSIVTGRAKSGGAAIGLAGTRTFAKVLRTFSGACIMMTRNEA
jgi:uncharacterized transporter YbjL